MGLSSCRRTSSGLLLILHYGELYNYFIICHNISEVPQSSLILCNPVDCIARQVPRSMGFSRQEYWSGLPCPSPGDLPYPGIEPWSLSLQADLLLSEPPGKPINSDGNKVHSKCNALESSQNHPPPPPPLPGRNCLPWNQSLVPKRLGTTSFVFLETGGRPGSRREL